MAHPSVVAQRVRHEKIARWCYRSWTDGVEQWYLSDADRYVERYDGKGAFVIVARANDSDKYKWSKRAPIVSGPYKKLSEAKRVYRVTHMVEGRELAFIT